ncbi:hypothetical protein EXIGLDRAFT_717911 [Exidia glandulosa HHB12029]|uniref:CFEM domain-containing protein n=1 Tax=Exidia glandulosa HHB12029 TaxID=1314781 RepID=A0A165P111_EXIGL|nr:hypothetical protein EXIGLDRAFT_717911 [Exidia glandulosa HHB12029]
MRSAAFVRSAIVLLSAIAFAAAQTATASPDGDDDLDNLTDCIEKCGDKLAPQFESACGQGTVDHPTEEQQRCLCSTPGVMDTVKACIPTVCPLDTVPDVLDFISASCQFASNGTESTASGPSGTQTQSAPSHSGTATDSASSSGSSSASDATTQSPTNQPDGGNAAPTTSAAVWMAGSIAAAAAFAAMV